MATTCLQILPMTITAIIGTDVLSVTNKTKSFLNAVMSIKTRKQEKRSREIFNWGIYMQPLNKKWNHSDKMGTKWYRCGNTSRRGTVARTDSIQKGIFLNISWFLRKASLVRE